MLIMVKNASVLVIIFTKLLVSEKTASIQPRMISQNLEAKIPFFSILSLLERLPCLDRLSRPMKSRTLRSVIAVTYFKRALLGLRLG